MSFTELQQIGKRAFHTVSRQTPLVIFDKMTAAWLCCPACERWRAAKEYRRRQKEYVRSLESRIAMMENQNQKMTEELDSLKELYSGKSHSS
ncbi:cyclic AMP-dependent transcription factor ATF-1 [Pimephales promelas]|nr:cyclic AMP-dependent transcription factor ATF-1 [Pimephales promelas]